MGFNSGFKGLIPVDRCFLVNGYSYRVVEYLFLADCCPLRFVFWFAAIRYFVAQIYPLGAGCIVICSIYICICRSRSLSFFQFFTLHRSLRLVFIDVPWLCFIQGPVEIPDDLVTAVSGTVGGGNLSLGALLARLKAFQLPWSAGL